MYVQTALFEAAAGCHVEVMRYLLEKGADPTVRTNTESESTGQDALVMAASGGNVEALTLLLDHPFRKSSSEKENREGRVGCLRDAGDYQSGNLQHRGPQASARKRRLSLA